MMSRTLTPLVSTVLLTAGCAAPAPDGPPERFETAELAWSTCGPENLALSARASADATLPGSSPSASIDGSAWSAWRAGPLYPYQTVRMRLSWDEGVPVRCLRVHWSGADHARELDVWIRDGYAWTHWGRHHSSGTATDLVLGSWADEIELEMRNANGRYFAVSEIEVR